MHDPNSPAFHAQPTVGQGTPAQTFLIPSILVTIFCCQIFGIVAIVYAAIATGKNSSGDYLGAADAGAKAKMWCLIGFGIGLVIIIGYIALVMLGVVAGIAGSAASP
ncbi:MAG: CD225/dispanin family protein [Phycisphaerales bacterium]|nr:CD225/dispanin family protein [Planctomycetota bacterium]MCH8507285.1 CD225/dispanin family protein [Phycisphaerales bacterium]